MLNSSDNLAEIGERFFRATFRVMGYLAKADGRVSEREIAAARGVMSDLRLNSQQVQAAIDYFTAGKQGNFDTAAESSGLRHACQGRPELLRVFLEIQVRAALGGQQHGRSGTRPVDPGGRPARRVAARAGANRDGAAHPHRQFPPGPGQGGYARTNGGGAEQLDQAYKVLETTPSASKDEIVKAYRRQLSRHHPDKLKANGLPDSMIEHAKQRTQLIIEAYELIRERRGI